MLGRFNGDDDVLAAEEVSAAGALETEADVLDDLRGCGEGGAGGGADAAVVRVELTGLTAEGVVVALKLYDAGDPGGGFMELDGVEDQKAAATVSGRGCGV